MPKGDGWAGAAGVAGSERVFIVRTALRPAVAGV